MAEFTYNDYLLHKVVQPFSLRGQLSENANIKKNMPLYLTRQAGKVREKFGNMDSKELITKQAVQPPPVFVDSQFEKLQAIQDGALQKKPRIDTNIGMKRTVQSIYDDKELDGKSDPIVTAIRSRIAMDRYTDDFFVLTEGAKQENIQKEEKLTVEKQLKTVLQEKVNEDQLKKLHRKFILETMKKNMNIDKKSIQFAKQRDKTIEAKMGSLRQIEMVQENKPFASKSYSLATFQQNNFGKKSKDLNIIHSIAKFDDEFNEEIEEVEDIDFQLLSDDRQSKSTAITNRKQQGIKEGFLSQPQTQRNAEESERGEITTIEEIAMREEQQKQLNKLREINKRQQAYKVNTKEGEKIQMRNICGIFNLNVPKLFNLEENKQMGKGNPRKLADISLNSSEEGQEEQLIKDDEVISNDDDDEKEDKRKRKQGVQIVLGQEEIAECRAREEQALVERLKYENEQIIANEQDYKIIQSIINLENKQHFYSKFVEKKKKEMQLQKLLEAKESARTKRSSYLPLSPEKQNNNNFNFTLENNLLISPSYQQQQQLSVKTPLDAIRSKLPSSNNSNHSTKNHSRQTTQIKFPNYKNTLQNSPQTTTFHSRQPTNQFVSIQSAQQNINMQKVKYKNSSAHNSLPYVSVTNQQQSQPLITLSTVPQNTQESVLANYPQIQLNTPSQYDRNESLTAQTDSNTFQERKKHDLYGSMKLQRQKSYKYYNGKPVHESSVLSFLKNDYKVQNKSDMQSKHSLTIKPFNHSKQSSDKINKNRLIYLSTPKYAVLDLDLEALKNSNLESASIMAGGSKTMSNCSSSRIKGKMPSVDFFTSRRENKVELEKMKIEFLNFFDDCFERKHQFEEEKQLLRQEISEWYCSNQQDLNKISSLTNVKLSTLSPEFKAFIEQKDFKKKLFNYLINSMEHKDRQMAVYLYKQTKQLDDL